MRRSHQADSDIVEIQLVEKNVNVHSVRQHPEQEELTPMNVKVYPVGRWDERSTLQSPFQLAK